MMRNFGKTYARCGGHKNVEAFTLTELIVTGGVLVLLILVGMSSANWLCYKSREAACLANLRQLGVAMSLYEKSNGGHLPFAFIEYNQSKYVSWDRLIYSYVSPGSEQKHLLRCPSDIIPANGGDPRRTYSMSQHNTSRRNWPPGPENTTGVGLWWSSRARWPAALWYLNSMTNGVPAISSDMISTPATTMLLTEQAQKYNVEFSYSGAAIDNPSAHLDTKIIRSEKYHGGKFNYLMVDGHVKLLSPLESLGENDPAFDDPAAKYQNVWTIRHD